MKIIEKPICAGSDRAFRTDRLDSCMIRCAQGLIVVPKARVQSPFGLRLRCRALSGCETLGMLFEPLDAE